MAHPAISSRLEAFALRLQALPEHSLGFLRQPNLREPATAIMGETHMRTWP